MRWTALALLCASTVALAAPPSPVGLWQTVDDQSGEPRSEVRLYEQDGAYFARVERTLVPGEEGALCTLCGDSRKDQPFVGMVIMRGMTRQGDGYGDGDILDPDSGKIYRCSFRLSDDGTLLLLRGYIGIPWLGRTQVWHRLQ